jgi:hypothetical protein
MNFEQLTLTQQNLSLLIFNYFSFLIKGINRDVGWFSITDDEWTHIDQTEEYL